MRVVSAFGFVLVLLGAFLATANPAGFLEASGLVLLTTGALTYGYRTRMAEERAQEEDDS